MKRNLLLLCLLGALLPAICSAQGDYRSGYIIKTNGDSLRGFVDYRFGGKAWKTAFYRSSKRASTERFSPDQVKAYGFRANKRFESIVVPRTNTLEFAEVLVKGPMSLYRHKGHFFVKTDSIIWLAKGNDRRLQKGNGSYVMKGRSYITILNALMADCSLRADRIHLTESSLVGLVQNYNRCKGGAGKVYKEDLPPWQLNYYVVSGMNTATLGVGSAGENVFRKDKALIYGGGLELSLPKVTDRLFFTLEINYTEYKTHGYYEKSSPPLIERTDYFVDSKMLRVPIGFRYNFFYDARTPYIKAGLVKVVDLGSELNEYKDVENYAIVTSFEKSYRLEIAGKTGYWAGVGFGQIIRGPVKGFLEIRFENAKGFAGHAFLEDSKFTTTSLLLGIRL